VLQHESSDDQAEFWSVAQPCLHAEPNEVCVLDLLMLNTSSIFVPLILCHSIRHICSVVVLETMVLVSSGLEAKFAGLGLERFGLDNNTAYMSA